MVDSKLLTQAIQKQFVDEDEYPMVIERVKKLRVSGQPDTAKDRLYIMTTHYIYTFTDQERTRLYKINDVGALIISSENQSDFSIFFERSDDLHISCAKRKDMLDLLKLRFNCLNRNITLRCYGVTSEQLITFMRNNIPQNKRRGAFDLPEEQCRMRDDEIKGEEEYNAELRRKAGTADDAPFEDMG